MEHPGCRLQPCLEKRHRLCDAPESLAEIVQVLLRDVLCAVSRRDPPSDPRIDQAVDKGANVAREEEAGAFRIRDQSEDGPPRPGRCTRVGDEVWDHYDVALEQAPLSRFRDRYVCGLGN